GTAPADDDDDVHAAHPGNRAESARDLVRRALALDARRPDDHVRVGVAPPEHLQNVPERRAFERRHDADLARQRWQRPLACTIEQAFGVELLLQLIEGELQRAQPLRLEVLADDLVFALGIVNAQPAAGDDVQPVFGLEAQIPDRRPEHDALDLRPAVLQREIHVAGVPHAAVRDLAFDPDVAEAALDRVADFRGQLRHGEDTA